MSGILRTYETMGAGNQAFFILIGGGESRMRDSLFQVIDSADKFIDNTYKFIKNSNLTSF